MAVQAVMSSVWLPKGVDDAGELDLLGPAPVQAVPPNEVVV